MSTDATMSIYIFESHSRKCSRVYTIRMGYCRVNLDAYAYCESEWYVQFQIHRSKSQLIIYIRLKPTDSFEKNNNNKKYINKRLYTTIVYIIYTRLGYIYNWYLQQCTLFDIFLYISILIPISVIVIIQFSFCE